MWDWTGRLAALHTSPDCATTGGAERAKMTIRETSTARDGVRLFTSLLLGRSISVLRIIHDLPAERLATHPRSGFTAKLKRKSRSQLYLPRPAKAGGEWRK